MFYTYIIYTHKRDRYYVGSTHNITLRVERHNSGTTKSTKSGIPWVLVYYEEYLTRSEAIKREYEIKKWKSRKLVEELVKEKS